MKRSYALLSLALVLVLGVSSAMAMRVTASQPSSGPSGPTIPNSALRLRPSEGTAGQTFLVIGYGYRVGRAVTIRWTKPSMLLGMTHVRGGGSFRFSATVPWAAPLGVHWVSIETKGERLIARFVVRGGGPTPTFTQTPTPTMTFTPTPRPTPTPTPTPAFVLSPSEGVIDQMIHVTGTSWEAGSTVTLRWGSANGPILATASIANDTFSTSFAVPANAYPATYTIWAISREEAEQTFTVVAPTATTAPVR